MYRAHQRKSLILRCFLSRNPLNLIRAFKIYVRPLLEYASSTWSPSYITVIIAIESDQRDYTKRIPGCAHLSYADRLSTLKLQSLEHRRLLADLCVAYNILNDKISTNNQFFIINPNLNLRGHPLKLSVPLVKSNTQKFFFSSRIISLWNSLPTPVVFSKTTISFKHQIKRINLDYHLTFRSIYDLSQPICKSSTSQ